MLVKPYRYAVVDSHEFLASVSDCTRHAEEIFAEGSKDKRMTAQKRLDYQTLISEQAPRLRSSSSSTSPAQM